MLESLIKKPLMLVEFTPSYKDFSRSELAKSVNNLKIKSRLDSRFFFLGECANLEGIGLFVDNDSGEFFTWNIECFMAVDTGEPVKRKRQQPHKDSLLLLSEQVTLVIDALDTYFSHNKNIPIKESKALAKISNALDFANDRARVSLGLPVDGDTKEKDLARLKLFLKDM